MENYKGIYFGTNTEQKSFEGGAHFRYKELYRELKILYENLPNERKGDLSSLHDTTIATRNARCPIVQSLTEKIKDNHYLSVPFGIAMPFIDMILLVISIAIITSDGSHSLSSMFG